jgi:hypothetical protein
MDLDKVLDTVVEIQKEHPDVYLGGSISLMLQNVLSRKLGDVDLETQEKMYIRQILKAAPHVNVYTYYTEDGVKYELLPNPSDYHQDKSYVEYNYKENVLRLVPAERIIKVKEKYILNPKCSDPQKHIDDINNYYNKLNK